jgi:hypothetical protein
MRDIFGGAMQVTFYDVVTDDGGHHDVSARRPLAVGRRFPMDGQEWEVVKVGPALSDDRAATVYCKPAR